MVTPSAAGQVQARDRQTDVLPPSYTANVMRHSTRHETILWPLFPLTFMVYILLFLLDNQQTPLSWDMTLMTRCRGSELRQTIPEDVQGRNHSRQSSYWVHSTEECDIVRYDTILYFFLYRPKSFEPKPFISGGLTILHGKTRKFCLSACLTIETAIHTSKYVYRLNYNTAVKQMAFSALTVNT